MITHYPNKQAYLDDIQNASNISIIDNTNEVVYKNIHATNVNKNTEYIKLVERTHVHLDIPDGVTSIASTALCRYWTLETCTIPEGVTQIEDQAFRQNTKLKNITLPSTLTTMATYEFYDCSKLQWVKCLATTPPTIGTQCFGNSNNCPIYVPAASLSNYKAAANWSTYASRIQAI